MAVATDIGISAHHQPTLDLLTQRLDIHEKSAWMLRSLLKK
jgi:starvation-inducible DNA-binding protein